MIGVGPFGEGMVVAKRLAHGPQVLQGPFLQAGDPKDGVGNPRLAQLHVAGRAQGSDALGLQNRGQIELHPVGIRPQPGPRR
ncbi:MAG: hypothetical protein ACLU9S_20815 [Oscillospiraceae bacterium]